VKANLAAPVIFTTIWTANRFYPTFAFMQRLTLLKTFVFRSIAFILLAVTAWVVVTPETNVYSVEKTFIKSHTNRPKVLCWPLRPMTRKTWMRMGQWIFRFPLQSQLPDFAYFLHEVFEGERKTVGKMNSSQAYLLHRQLLIDDLSLGQATLRFIFPFYFPVLVYE